VRKADSLPTSCAIVTKSGKLNFLELSGPLRTALPFKCKGLDRLRELQEVEAPRFQDNRHMKVVSLSALPTGRLNSTGDIPGSHFCHSLSRTKGHSAAGKIITIKNPIGIQTRDLPAGSAVPQPTAPLRSPHSVCSISVSLSHIFLCLPSAHL